MPHFAGIDLAWTAHNESGICVVEGTGPDARLVLVDAVCVTPGGLAADLAALGEVVVAAIDAPLLVGPGRQAERLLGALFGRYRAGAHSASLPLLEREGRMAGPHLAQALSALGFSLDPLALTPHAPGRSAFEVYPHAAHVCWFRLDGRLKYKRKAHRPVALCRDELRRLQALLAGRLAAELPAVARDLAPVLAPAAADLRGRALKRLEDQLDAVTCMLAAYLGWRDGLTAADVVGDAVNGYMAVPGLAADPRFATSVPAPTSP